MKKLRWFVFAILSFIWFCSSAYATVISYDTTNITGNRWQYNYTIVNDTLADNIEAFTIYFDVGLYDHLSFISVPTDWDPLTIQPDANLPGDGFFDALALVSGIAPSDLLGGFSISFDWLGQDAPGDQFFEIYDAGFSVIDSGMTQFVVPINVPEPASILLFFAGWLLFRRFEHQNQKNRAV